MYGDIKGNRRSTANSSSRANGRVVQSNMNSPLGRTRTSSDSQVVEPCWYSTGTIFIPKLVAAADVRRNSSWLMGVMGHQRTAIVVTPGSAAKNSSRLGCELWIDDGEPSDVAARPRK